MGMENLGLRKKILDEILEDLDSHEGERLRPKAAVSVTSVEPDAEDMLQDEGIDHPMLGGGGDDDDEDELKALLSEYLAQK